MWSIERSNIDLHIQISATDGAEVGIFQMAEVPMDMYNLNAPPKHSTSYVCFFAFKNVQSIFFVSNNDWSISIKHFIGLKVTKT